MNDLIIRSGFGIMNLLEVENVNQENGTLILPKQQLHHLV